MEGDGLYINVHSVGVGRIRKTTSILVPTTATLADVMKLIEHHPNIDRNHRIHTLAPLDLSKIGHFHYPGRVFHTKDPDAKPTFVLNKEDPSKLATDCGLYDGAELVITNGEMD